MKASIPRTVKTSLVETLRDEIIQGDHAPGQHLRLEEIAARYDVSTMPVREALRDLEAEGIVTIFPHRGAVVTKLTAGELKTRGYYLGSNVSYNLKKLVDMGYIDYKRSETDRRSVRVSLTTKGKDACDVVQKLYQRQLGSIEAVGEVSNDDVRSLNRALVRLERFWSDQIRYRL